MRAKGKSLFEQAKFTAAQKTFTKLVQSSSLNPKDYLYLARCANRAKDFMNSSVAYQIYFELTDFQEFFLHHYL